MFLSKKGTMKQQKKSCEDRGGRLAVLSDEKYIRKIHLLRFDTLAFIGMSEQKVVEDHPIYFFRWFNNVRYFPTE